MHDSFKVLCQDLAIGRTKILDKILTIGSSRAINLNQVQGFGGGVIGLSEQTNYKTNAVRRSIKVNQSVKVGPHS